MNRREFDGWAAALLSTCDHRVRTDAEIYEHCGTPDKVLVYVHQLCKGKSEGLILTGESVAELVSTGIQQLTRSMLTMALSRLLPSRDDQKLWSLAFPDGSSAACYTLAEALLLYEQRLADNLDDPWDVQLDYLGELSSEA